ncbi:hypothetical protein [Sagittula sp. SSi028]|uniref:hypothetical protein n=1 Tax=Sagittula sp. SSi028 TaxID=3400636 RepID=UPI003AF6E424
MGKTRSGHTRSEAKTTPTEETADLARGANGLSDLYDAQQEAAEGMIRANMEAVSAVMAATASTWQAAAAFWAQTLPKPRKDDDTS